MLEYRRPRMRMFLISLSLGFSSLSMAEGPARKKAANSVFYYSHSTDGSLRFTDEPPSEMPQRRASKRQAKMRQNRINAVELPPQKTHTFDTEVYVPQSEILVTYRPAERVPLLPTKHSRYIDLIQEAAARYRVDAALIAAIVKTESANNPLAVSHKGARGLMQLMLETAAELGVKDIHDPKQNVFGGTRYIKQLLRRYEGDVDLALAAYNAGPAAVDRYKGIPPYPETIDYVARVRKYYAQFESF